MNLSQSYPLESDNQSLFDPNGNPQRAMLGPVGQQTERTYTYHPRTNRVASTTVRPIDYLYNPSGNMTHSETAHEDGQIDLGWDIFLNLPAEVTHPVWEQNQGTTHFTYGSNRQRVVKRTEEPGATNTTHYIHGLSAQPLSVTHCVDVTNRNECWGAAYIWGPDGLIAERHTYLGNPSDERFVVKDHLGSVRLIVDADNGTVRAWQDYAPFGEVMRGADISAHLRYTYTGQEADTELGLMNYQARLYDPEIGIFLASDPAGQIAASYVYAGNNPISYVDPDGEWFIEALTITAAAIAAITRGYNAYQASGGDMIYTITSAVMGGVKGGMSTYVGITVGRGVSTLASPALASYVGWHTGSVYTGVVTGYAAGGAVGGMAGYATSTIFSGNRISAGGLGMAALSAGLMGGASSAYRYHTSPGFRVGSLYRALSYGLSATEGSGNFHVKAGYISMRFLGVRISDVTYSDATVGLFKAGFGSDNTLLLAPGAFGDASIGVTGYGYYEWGEYGPIYGALIDYDINTFITVMIHEAYHPKLLMEEYGYLKMLYGVDFYLHELNVSRAVLGSPYLPYLGTSGLREAIDAYIHYKRRWLIEMGTIKR